MPKKDWTDEERKAFAEKMKASRNKTTQAPATQATPPVAEQTNEAPAAPKVELTQEQFQSLMERLGKLESSRTETVQGPSQANIDALGQIVGVMQKFSVDPRDYIDPREDLYVLPELERFAFRTNYYLKWDVEQTQYTTKFGTSYSEPRFELRLYKRLYDDDGTPMIQTDETGKPTYDEQGNPQYRSYLVQKAFFFEDPAASMKEAQQLGIPVTNANSKDFLEKMRHLRYKSWLLEVFNKPKSAQPRRKQNMVVGSTVVEVETYSSEV